MPERVIPAKAESRSVRLYAGLLEQIEALLRQEAAVVRWRCPLASSWRL
jgi:hypothetical protein